VILNVVNLQQDGYRLNFSCSKTVTEHIAASTLHGFGSTYQHPCLLRTRNWMEVTITALSGRILESYAFTFSCSM